MSLARPGQQKLALLQIPAAAADEVRGTAGLRISDDNAVLQSLRQLACKWGGVAVYGQKVSARIRPDPHLECWSDACNLHSADARSLCIRPLRQRSDVACEPAPTTPSTRLEQRQAQAVSMARLPRYILHGI